MKKINLNHNKFALVDDDDYHEINKYKWYAVKHRYTWYAQRVDGKTHIHMSREILYPKDGVLIDHIDGNGLNNQKENLRFSSNSQNIMNSRVRKDNNSGYKGVSKCGRGSWRVRIVINGVRIHLGVYKTPEEAAIAYDVAAKKHYKEFARTNFG